MGKGKTEMPEYEDKQYEGNKSSDSLDSEFGAFDVPLMRTHGEKKAIAMANENFDALPVRSIILVDLAITTTWHTIMPL